MGGNEQCKMSTAKVYALSVVLESALVSRSA